MFSMVVHDFHEWRKAARLLVANKIHPHQVMWNDRAQQSTLFNDTPTLDETKTAPTIAREFITLADIAACHRHPERWNLLYHALWRLTHGEKNLLRLSTDPLTHALFQMQQSVRRDAHKAKAFVRFRQTTDEEGVERYVAWHRPDHYILPVVAPFFKRRFASMQWSILTPDQSVWWDGSRLHYGAGVEAATVTDDALEDVWRGYYKAIFNPARVSVSAMKREMPVRHWATLPEASVIHELLTQAPTRVDRMIKTYEGSARSAADYLPEAHDIDALRHAANHCEGCPLYQCATQTVFGAGPINARVMLVGEQPGDEEDKTGEPFVGPAGQMLNRALADAGVDRDALYVTNAVKHFKYELLEGTRYHRTPSLREITGCKPWLEAEIAAIRPERVVCLGVSAARSLIHPGFVLKDARGVWSQSGQGPEILATYHPSAILRGGSKSGELYHALVEDLKKIHD